MSPPSHSSFKIDAYQRSYEEYRASGSTLNVAILRVTEAYLDGKPASRGKHKLTQGERDKSFWSSDFLIDCPADVWGQDVMTLALARYLDQERVANPQLLSRVADISPETICTAIRYARMAFCPKPARLGELRDISSTSPQVREQCRILEIFASARRERQQELERWRDVFAELSPFEILIYASLYAFEYLVPAEFSTPGWTPDRQAGTQTTWRAIDQLIAWKLATSPESSIKLSERKMAISAATHLSPFLFPSPTGARPRHDLRMAFEALVAAQVEMDEFMERSVDAYSYDDAVRFVLRGEVLEIDMVDSGIRDKWLRDGRKLSLLHGYWFNRALVQFASSNMAFQTIGRPENHEANRLAYIRAQRTQLQLAEVYGIDDGVMLDSGERVGLFKALLSLELTSAFFQRDFLQRYAELRDGVPTGMEAIAKLAWEGLVEGMQNRFPLTWSEREEKIHSIVGWTVCEDYPQGSLTMAAAILDFWTSDWTLLGARLSRGESGLIPEVLERPFLKLGRYFVQLPWITGLQNNCTAAINNLRRIGARRPEARDETQRIEDRLGQLFVSRGFRVLTNWFPSADRYPGVGEIDLICCSDSIVLVIEVKSTFRRRSQRDAWLHANTTLRRAGQQLRRKLVAVRDLIAGDSDFRCALGIEETCTSQEIRGWIADTSIESDHERFDGFLKVSVEELIVALRDERAFLADPEKFLMDAKHSPLPANHYEDRLGNSLYPEGFCALQFVNVIENESVWRGVA